MPQVRDWKPSDPIQLLIFGKFKIGKSWGAFTFPRPVVFDFDGGMATARNPEFVKKYGLRWIFYESFKDTDRNARGIVTKHTGFDQACLFFDEWMKPNGRWLGVDVGRDMFDTFVIDSGTSLSDLCMSKAAIVLGSQGLSQTQKSAAESGILIPKKQDYGAERSLIEQFIRMVKDSGKNLVLIAHEKEIYEGEGSAATLKGVVPLFTGQSVEHVPLMFDEVYNLRIKPVGAGTVRYLQTVPDALRRCGSRYGIPSDISWDYDTLKGHIDRIHAEQQKQVQPVTQTVGGGATVAGAVSHSIK